MLPCSFRCSSCCFACCFAFLLFSTRCCCRCSQPSTTTADDEGGPEASGRTGGGAAAGADSDGGATTDQGGGVVGGARKRKVRFDTKEVEMDDDAFDELLRRQQQVGEGWSLLWVCEPCVQCVGEEALQHYARNGHVHNSEFE